MKKIFLIMTLTIFAVNSVASEVLVTTAEPTTKEQLAELTEHYRSVIKEGDFVSSYEYLLSHPASQSQMAVILDLDSEGRAASLNGNFKRAETYYTKLLSKLESLPNIAGLEKITLATRINLAHMAIMLKHPTAEALWKEAHAWDPTAKLSPEEFSPAVILRFEKPSQLIKKRLLNLQVSNTTAVYVDGQKIRHSEHENSRSVLLEPGHHQVAALLPGTTWAIQNFDIKEGTKPVTVSLKPTPFVKGACENPKFIATNLNQTNKILVHFDETCARVYSDKKWFNLDGKFIPSPVKISDDLKPGAEGASEPEGTLMATKPKPGFVSQLLHSPWFWTGVGAVVVGGLAISHNQTTTEPTHTVSN